MLKLKVGLKLNYAAEPGFTAVDLPNGGKLPWQLEQLDSQLITALVIDF